jgi:hypothetical protein
MPKVYVLDSETPSYSLYREKPIGFHTDEIELTDEELKAFEASEAASVEGQDLIRSKLSR